MKKAVHLVVSGRVQGVFFRASCSDVARKLNVTGFVRNVPNGSVEVHGEGEKEFLERLIDWCRKGPPGAYVEEVAVEWLESTNQFRNFGVH